MKRLLFYLALTGFSLLLACCAPLAATPAQTPSPTTAVNFAPTQTPFDPPNPATAEPSPVPPMTPTPSQPSSTPASELVTVLETAAQEMAAAETAASLADVRGHAKVTVNLLVGKYGRWYDDSDGNGSMYDPSAGQGVLPGEILTQGADLDTGTKFPSGLILDAAGTNPNLASLKLLLGDVDVWRTRPRAGYDTIEMALKNASTSPNLDALHGAVPRAVAFARLILTDAKTPQDAHTLALKVSAELNDALRGARMSSP